MLPMQRLNLAMSYLESVVRVLEITVLTLSSALMAYITQ